MTYQKIIYIYIYIHSNILIKWCFDLKRRTKKLYLDLPSCENSLKIYIVNPRQKSTIGKDSCTTRTRICEHTKDEWQCFDSSKLLLLLPHDDLCFILYLFLLLINIGHVLFLQVLHICGFHTFTCKGKFQEGYILWSAIDLGPIECRRKL